MFNEDEIFIKQITDFIVDYIKERSELGYNKHGFIELCSDINKCLKIWTGETWVGDKKPKKIKNTFQNFFIQFHNLLQSIHENPEQYSDDEKIYASRIIYHGMVFRYLGNNDPYNKTIITPVYNDIYVSWNKKPQCSYIESKLYGTITWLSADIQVPLFGIDLEGVENAFCSLTNEKIVISKPNEHEVVFPTIKKCIKEIKYIKDDEEDE